MTASLLLAVLDTHPDGPGWARGWLEEVLQSALPGYADRPDATMRLRGWSVGTVWGTETLVQSRPIIRGRDIDPLDDLLRTPSQCILAAFSVFPTNRPELTAPPPVKLSRFRRWIGVRSDAVLPPEQARQLRQQLPDFLARGQVHRNDGELVFLTFLAQLHSLGGLSKAYAQPEQIRQALGLLDTVLHSADQGSENLMVSDGRTFAMLHRGGTMLAFEPRKAPPTRAFRVAPSSAAAKPRTHLLLHGVSMQDGGQDNASESAPHLGGERLGEGIFSINVREPGGLTREASAADDESG